MVWFQFLLIIVPFFALSSGVPFIPDVLSAGGCPGNIMSTSPVEAYGNSGDEARCILLDPTGFDFQTGTFYDAVIINCDQTPPTMSFVNVAGCSQGSCCNLAGASTVVTYQAPYADAGAVCIETDESGGPVALICTAPPK